MLSLALATLFPGGPLAYAHACRRIHTSLVVSYPRVARSVAGSVASPSSRVPSRYERSRELVQKVGSVSRGWFRPVPQRIVARRRILLAARPGTQRRDRYAIVHRGAARFWLADRVRRHETSFSLPRKRLGCLDKAAAAHSAAACRGNTRVRILA